MDKASSNFGEKNEVFLQAFLVRAYHLKLKLVNAPKGFQLIQQLGFGPGNKIPNWTEEYEEWLNNKDYDKLKTIFKKSKSNLKADIEINSIRYSVKTSFAAMPAIVNHTNRVGFQKVLVRLNNHPIRSLDNMVMQYWDLRKRKVISEDVKNSHKSSPFYNEKEYFRPILEYFLFKGTGRGDSIFPADKLLVFKDPFDPSTYKIYTAENAVDELWDSLIFSVRSKGMPKIYDPAIKHVELAPWVMLADEVYKGSLHVRSK